MAQRITSIDPHTPARRAGLRVGDELIAINGQPVVDFIDYQALTAQTRLQIRYRRADRMREVSLNKQEYEPLGARFDKPMMSGMRMCANHCLFCFVDQLPKDVRPTMRVKDDDWRMSLMMGNYVTLTNVSDHELERIIERHASPLYISVHAADLELRTRILQTPRAARMKAQLEKLSAGGIEFHTQAVLCPGINDGKALEETIEYLTTLSGAKSLALVPVGLTGHRAGLYPLKPYTPAQAREVLAIADHWREHLLQTRGTRFVFPADEFYLIAGEAFPPDEAYEDYDQIDDGVGLLRKLDAEFSQAWKEYTDGINKNADANRRAVIACGTSAAPFLADLMRRCPVAGLSVTVQPIENRFFGPSVTVSGLITGGDLVGQLKDCDADIVLITECMLRNEGDRFLDDMELTAAEAQLRRPIVPVGRSGAELLDALLTARNA